MSKEEIKKLFSKREANGEEIALALKKHFQEKYKKNGYPMNTSGEVNLPKALEPEESKEDIVKQAEMIFGS